MNIAVTFAPLVLAIVFTSVAVAEEEEEAPEIVELWECFSYLDENTTLFTLAQRRWSSGKVDGGVQLAGMLLLHNSQFKVEGLNRRWDWGMDDSGYRYSIVVSPDGTANYYDFRNADSGVIVGSQQSFKCKNWS